MSALNPDHVAWCRRHFASLRDGGVWGFPNAGFIFQRQDTRLVLTARMPWQPELPMGKAAWTKHQREWLDATVEHFAAAGVEIIDVSKP